MNTFICIYSWGSCAFLCLVMSVKTKNTLKKKKFWQKLITNKSTMGQTFFLLFLSHKHRRENNLDHTWITSSSVISYEFHMFKTYGSELTGSSSSAMLNECLCFGSHYKQRPRFPSALQRVKAEIYNGL